MDSLDENMVVVFYPAVSKNRYLEYEANEGAVVSITATSVTPSRAINKMYSEAEDISFESVYYRRDICKPKI